MEVSQSHMNWGSGSNTLDNSTMMFAAECNDAPSDFYQRLLRDEDMTPPHSGCAQGDNANILQNLDDLERESAPEQNCAEVDNANVLQNLDDLEQFLWEGAQEQNCAEVDIANVLQNLDDLEQLHWEGAPEQNWEPAQHLPSVPMEELQCPPTSQAVPVEFPTVNQSGESHETGGEHEYGQEDQSAECAEWGGECSGVRIDEATSPPVLPSGEKIGVTYHKKNKQWEAHLWIRGPQLRGRKKKGVQIFLGNFETEEEAKVAHDRAAIKLKIPPSARGEPYPLNFPAAVYASYMEEHADWTARDFLWKIRRTSNKFSKGKSSLKGVSVRKRSVKRGKEWAANYESKLSLTAKESGDDLKRTFQLGNFESEEEAGQAYDKALLFLHQHLPEVEQLRYVTNYRPSSYSAAAIQAIASKVAT